MDSPLLTNFLNNLWDGEIVPALSDYIRIPNKSPAFDPDWEAHGYMEQVVALFEGWAREKMKRCPAPRWKWCGCRAARR